MMDYRERSLQEMLRLLRNKEKLGSMHTQSMASIIWIEFLKTKLCQVHKKYDPELEMNMPVRYSFDSYSKDKAKKVSSVWKCWHSETFFHTISLHSYHEKSIFFLKLHYHKYCLPRARNNKAGKSQKPDYARDDTAPIILLQPRKRKLRTHFENRYSKMKVTADFLLLQNANFIPSGKKKMLLACFLLGYSNTCKMQIIPTGIKAYVCRIWRKEHSALDLQF